MVITVAALISSPLASVTPVTRPLRVRILATSAPVRTSAPTERAAAASALVTPPIPPRGNPHAPACPPVSPMWWCSITYAVPGDLGPAQAPITPETASTPRTASLSK